MGKVHFVDTSILVNLLDVPHLNEHCTEVRAEYHSLTENGDTFILPIATLIETGNHIAHITNGNMRYEIAKKFVALGKEALNQTGMWHIAPAVSSEQLGCILEEFPAHAIKEVGLGDVSIIKQYEEYWKNKQPIGEMRIWSLDDHLQAYPSHTGGLSRRKHK